MGSQEGAKPDEVLHVWGYLVFNDQKAVRYLGWTEEILTSFGNYRFR